MMPRINYRDYDKDDVTKVFAGDIVFWSDPNGHASGNYEIVWTSDPPERQDAATKIRLWSDKGGEITVSLGSLRSR
jgi:hypothetical protein